MSDSLDADHKTRLLKEIDAYVDAQALYAARKAKRPLELSEELIGWLGLPACYAAAIGALKSAPEERAEVVAAMMRLLRSMSPLTFSLQDEVSVLAGLCRQGWKDCLATTEDAHCLALAALRYVAYHNPDYHLDIVIAPVVCKVLNIWCRPTEEWKVLPPLYTLCQHFFGEAWCQFYLTEPGTNGGSDADRGQLIVAVKLNKPDFAPGMCDDNGAKFSTPTGALPTLPDNLGAIP